MMVWRGMNEVGSAPPARARAGVGMRRPSTAALTGFGIGVVVAVYAVLAWDRRWIADDGLIVVRTAREILAGNGPVYSPFERAESSTSTLWVWLVAAVGWVAEGNLARLAVVVGGVLAVGGFAIAIDAARRCQRASGATSVLVPAGALVVVAVFPFWDFATSGLETGLSIAWLAVIWWWLRALQPDTGPQPLAAFAVLVGLGPLVRPDFAIVTAVFLAAGWLIVRPSWRRTLWLAGAAAAVPLAYEVFRAGYYGTLVPLPALAKSASGAEWARGAEYAIRFAKPHLLYVPLAVLAVVAVAGRVLPRPRVVVAAPVIAALLLAVFVVRVGGDFMHGRLLLPSTLLLVAPVLVLPLNRLMAVALPILVAWGLYIGIQFYTGARRATNDERLGYTKYTGQRNPTTEDAYIPVPWQLAPRVAEALRTGQRRLLAEGGNNHALSTAHTARIAVVMGHLGVGGAIAPLDGIVVDVFGLANPLGARITRTQPGRVGHEKNLPWAWVLADFADPADPESAKMAPPAAIASARHALTCGDIAELIASVRAPLTPARFWANLTGAFRRTRLVIPSDPIEAERTFCASP